VRRSRLKQSFYIVERWRFYPAYALTPSAGKDAFARRTPVGAPPSMAIGMPHVGETGGVDSLNSWFFASIPEAESPFPLVGSLGTVQRAPLLFDDALSRPRVWARPQIAQLFSARSVRHEAIRECCRNGLDCVTLSSIQVSTSSISNIN